MSTNKMNQRQVRDQLLRYLGGIHFLALDSYGEEEKRYRLYDTTGPQVKWIKRDLEMKGHYGPEKSFRAALYDLSMSSGRNDGSPDSAPYQKDATNKGTVYVVSGSAGQLGGKQHSYPHDAMYFSDATHGGADMIKVRGNRLDFTWICADSNIRSPVHGRYILIGFCTFEFNE